LFEEIPIVIVIRGTVSTSKAENVKNLERALCDGPFKNLLPHSYLIDFNVYPPIGTPYIPMTEEVVPLINTLVKPEPINEHNPGQVWLLNFWERQRESY
jgi:hypothetical protein